MRTTSTLFGTAAAVTLLVASAARPVSAQRGPSPSDCVANGTCCFVKSAARVPFKPPVIDIVFDNLTVGDTGIDRARVRRALRRQASPIEVCFHGGDGTVDVVFVIDPAGGAHRTDASAADSRLARCIASALRRVAFPSSDDHTVTEVHVTITGTRR